MRMMFWNETQKTSKCHIFIERSRSCYLSTRSATYHLLRCALDYRRSSSDFEPRNWYLQLSRKVCHLHTVWWKGRTWQILFLVLCFLSNYNYHCIFLFHNFVVVRKKKSCCRSFGSSFAWNTNSFCKQFLIQQSKLSKQTETTQTKIILGGIRTRDLWIRSPARYPLRYADFWKEWVLIGKSEWYRDEGTLHLLFFFILNNSDR